MADIVPEYPSGLEMLHPGLTEKGREQVSQLTRELDVSAKDLILVSPTKQQLPSIGKRVFVHAQSTRSEYVVVLKFISRKEG